jgi:hypothetical protein
MILEYGSTGYPIERFLFQLRLLAAQAKNTQLPRPLSTIRNIGGDLTQKKPMLSVSGR